ncbi:MAG: hypothetical protein MJ069_03065 [Salinivirgaceae bacterium]|nr:hypothetical protein [Salinivirgaceae bacterium]
MGQKADRHTAIAELVTNNEVTSQEMLLDMLKEKGIVATQATLSRDLKRMKIFKRSSILTGNYCYALPETITTAPVTSTTSPLDGLVSIEFSGSMAVVKTLPAYAQPVSQIIDDAQMVEIAGTIAGNDTILMVLRNGFTKKQVKQTLLSKFPSIKDKL